VKQETVHKLASLMKTKTQLERFQYEEVKQHNMSALQEAAKLRGQALTMPQAMPENSGAMVFQQHEKNVTRLLDHAKSKKQYADSLVDLMDERRQMVKAALQREIALEEIANRLKEEQRISRNKREEAQHEHVRSMKTIRRKA